MLSASMLCLLSLFSLQTNKPTSQTSFTGQLINDKTNEKIIGANVQVVGTRSGAVTDTSGCFRLSLDRGRYQLYCTHLAFEAKRVQIQTPTQGRFEIRMTPKTLAGQDVTVSATMDIPEIQRFEITARSIQQMPNPLPEVLSMLRTLPGVSALNDQSSFYSVRGGGYDENLIYLNNTEIYQPHLVRKGIAENPSLLHPYLVHSINLQSGSFPVYYGDKLSSVLDVRYRDHSDRRISGNVDLSTTGVLATCEWQPQDRLHLLAAGRIIRYGYLFSKLQTRGNYHPSYQDLQLAANYKPSARWQWSALAIHGQSAFKSEPREASYFVMGSVDSLFLNSSYQGKEEFTFRTTVVSGEAIYQWNDRHRLSWHNSYIRQREWENSHVQENLDGSLLTGNIGDSLSVHYYQEDYENRFLVESWNSRLQWFGPLAGDWNLRLGAELKKLKLTDHIQEYRFDMDLRDSTMNEQAVWNYRGQRLQPLITSQFIHCNGPLFKKWQADVGLRLCRSSLNRELLLLPRIRISSQLSDRHQISLAWGRYAQPPTYREYQWRDGPVAGLDAQKQSQATLGFLHQLRPDLVFKWEAFYKRYSDLISFDVDDVLMHYSGVNDGRGYAYGIDVQIEGAFLPGTKNWISYAYLVAREDLFTDHDGYVPRPNDQRHTFAYYMEDQMKRFPNSKFHVRMVFGSGYPTTDYRWRLNKEDYSWYLQKQPRLHYRLPFYERFDIGMQQIYTLPHGIRLILREEILNLFDHVNIVGYEYAFQQKLYRTLGGRVFNLGVHLEM